LLGYVDGAPNTILVFDVTEVADQGYEDLLRDEKRIVPIANDLPLPISSTVIVFPGKYSLQDLTGRLTKGVPILVDAAYDTQSFDELAVLGHDLRTVVTSTSSRLFLDLNDQTLDGLAARLAGMAGLKNVVLKENRGGTRARDLSNGSTHVAGAQLGTTVNSVGVGDVFDVALAIHEHEGMSTALTRASFASSAYAQTTYPEIFKDHVQRELLLSPDELTALPGTILPWEARPAKHIYIAAPDFERIDRQPIERASAALKYHNFTPRRPVLENGEIPTDSDAATLAATYQKDVVLLDECSLLFAIPIGRDPGTLVEIGLAIDRGIPVITYDVYRECANTMVMAGSSFYSTSLGDCLEATFKLLSQRT
jgi:nucleoside 2-deoxyribosyltransferase